MFDINGKTAIVTGGTSGIGLATAEAFLRKGAKVVIAARNEKRGAEALAHLKEISDTVAFRKTDTSDEEDVKALVAFAVDTFGSLDIMYNNAGIGDMAPIDQMTGENFRKLIDINLTGVFYGIKYAALQMEKQGTGGAIVNTSSIEGMVGDPMLPSYNAAKGGVNLMTQSAALALAKYHIRVNTVNPGYIETGMVNEDAMGKEAIDHLVSLHPLDVSAGRERLPTASSSSSRTNSRPAPISTSTAATRRSRPLSKSASRGGQLMAVRLPSL